MAAARPLGWVMLVAGLLGQPAAAQEQPQQELSEIEQQLAADKAKAAELEAREAAIRAEIADLTRQLVAVAAKAQALEAALTDVEETQAALAGELADRQTRLAAERGRLSAMLAALVRIALQPPEALLAEPGSPLDAARSALLLGQLVPELERRAAALRADLEELRQLEQQIAAENASAAATQAALAAEQQNLAALLARKEALAEIAAAERAEAEARVAALADKAADLKELIAALEREAAEREAAERAAAEAAAKAEAEARARAEAEAAAAAAEQQQAAEQQAAEQQAAEQPAAGAEVALAAPSGLRDFPESPGGLFLPARGSVQAGYGQPLPDGEESRGLLLETRPGAQIVATFDGRVVYAGAFRRYGLILILEHGGRYHSLLAGLGRIDVVLGQWVVAGEPVGLMASPAGAAPALYIELRHNGQPIDPTPWFGNQLSQGPSSKGEG